MSKNPSEPSGLGSTVRWLREEIEMSQAQLALGAEISQGYLSQIENDEVQNPSAASLLRLAAALGIDPRVLMKAGGYGEGGEEPVDESEFSIYLELLRFLAELSSDYQTVLYAFLRGFTLSVEGVLEEEVERSNEGGMVELAKARRPRRPKNPLGNAIRRLREASGRTQGQLADSATVSQGYLSQLESGEMKNPSVAVLLRLAVALRIPADDLFEAAGYPTVRRLRDEYRVLESRVLPRLREFLAALSSKSQRRLLKHLRDIGEVIVSADKPKSLAADTEKAPLST